MTTHPAYTLVLTAEPGTGAVSEGVAKAALALLPGAGRNARWLAPGDAWEAGFEASQADIAAIQGAAIEAVGSEPVDANIVRGGPEVRRKRLLCADMESTIIQQELIDEMADLVGCRSEISAITRAAMRGEIAFATSLMQRVALFEGLEAQRLEPLLAGVTLMPGAETLLATMRANGAWTALISGGFTIFAERIAAKLGIHAVAANVLEIENGCLLGTVRSPILDPQGKADALKRLTAEGRLGPVEALAAGDGANDVAMLAAAGLGVAFRAKPILAEQARSLETGAVVTHGDLTALLYLQGYTRDAFVETAPAI